MKTKRFPIETIEVATAPKGAYEALVYDLAKLLNCAEDEQSIKNTIQNLQLQSNNLPDSIKEALNSGDGVYRP